MLITEQLCGPKKDWVQFFSGDETVTKQGEGTVRIEDREAFRKILEARLLPLANRDYKEKE